MGREKEKEWNKIDKVSKAEKKRDKKKLKEKAEDQGGLLVPGGVTMGGIPSKFFMLTIFVSVTSLSLSL